MPIQYHLSKGRYEELKKELENLKGEGRTDVAEKLKRAKEYGDLSENAEYAEAREEQNLIENRIFELEELLKKAIILSEEGAKGGDVVRVGCTVTVAKSGKEMKYVIVGPYDAKPEEGKISDQSPLGQAFLGHKEGEEVMVFTPSGKSKFEIRKVE